MNNIGGASAPVDLQKNASILPPETIIGIIVFLIIISLILILKIKKK